MAPTAGQKMYLGLPAPLPRPALVEAIRAQCERAVEERAAWLLQMILEGGEPHPLLALELETGSAPGQVMPRRMEGIEPLLAKGEYLDALPMTPGSQRSAGVREMAAPIFTRPPRMIGFAR